MKIRLNELNENHSAKIVSFNGGEKMLDRMLQHGIYPGDRLILKRTALMRGPYLIEIDGREIILGRMIANKIIVETEE